MDLRNSDVKLFFLTHHKCGSGWFNNIHFELTKIMGLRMHIINNNDFGFKHINDYYSDKKLNFLSFNNADPDFIDFDDNFRAVHVVRDPRDIIVSGYFSHKNTHPLHAKTDDIKAMREHRKVLNKVSQEEGLIEEIHFSKKWYIQKLDKLARHGQDKVMRLHFEEITNNPSDFYHAIISQFGLNLLSKASYIDWLLGFYNKIAITGYNRVGIGFPYKRTSISRKELDVLLNKFTWEKLTRGRSKGLEDKTNHFRKGKKGDWKNYFTPSVYSEFKKELGETIGLLGYET